MRAIIFAAGKGTRLRPITDHTPKALVKVQGRPLLDYAYDRLVAAGCKQIVVNIHHHAAQVEAWAAGKPTSDVQLYLSDERGQLLETGGGLQKVSAFFEEAAAFIAINADILTDLDLQKMYNTHLESGALATLAVRQRSSSRHLLFNKDQELAGWTNNKTGEVRWSRPETEITPLAFSGQHIISPGLFNFFPEKLSRFSIIDTYLEAAKTAPVKAYLHDADQWFDIGNPEKLALAEQHWNENGDT